MVCSQSFILDSNTVTGVTFYVTSGFLGLCFEVIIIQSSCDLLKHLHALHAEGEAGAEVATGVLGIEHADEFVEGVREQQHRVDNVDELRNRFTSREGSLGAKLLDGLKSELNSCDLLAVHHLLGAPVLFELLGVVTEEDATFESCQEIHGHLIFYVHCEKTGGLDGSDDQEECQQN